MNIRNEIKQYQNLGILDGFHVLRKIYRHAGHCWRSRDELISDVLLWTPTYGRTKAGRPARTYIQQLCDDTGYCPEDVPQAMNDKEKWRERVRDMMMTTCNYSIISWCKLQAFSSSI